MWRTAIGYLLLEVLLLAARTALQSAGRLVDAQLNHVLRFGITRRIMAHAAVLDIDSYEDKQLQERMQRISDETPWRVQEILGAIFNVAGETATLIAVLLIIVQLGGWCVGLLFGATSFFGSLLHGLDGGCGRPTVLFISHRFSTVR
jgi:hypothetical protein